MKRSVWAALGVVLVALAVPTMALATHHHSFRHHRHHHAHTGSTGGTGATGAAATVASYNQGVLTLDLSAGGTLTGAVTDRTHFVCIGANGNSHSSQHGRRYSVRHAGNGATGDTGSSGPTGPTGGTGTGSTGSTGTGGYYHDHGHGHGHGEGGGFAKHSHGYGQGHDYSQTPPPPCDSSLLSANTALQGAEVLLVPGGVQFSIIIVVLPAVQ